MTNLQRLVEGTVLMLRCRTCSAVFPHFLFSGEQDTDTDRLCSASACDTIEVVVAEATADEWNDLAHGSVSVLQARLSSQLARDDLRVLRILRVEPGKNSGKGASFQDFRKEYSPPITIFSCACCGGDSEATEEITVDAFQKAHGRLHVLGNLAVSVTT